MILSLKKEMPLTPSDGRYFQSRGRKWTDEEEERGEAEEEVREEEEEEEEEDEGVEKKKGLVRGENGRTKRKRRERTRRKNWMKGWRRKRVGPGEGKNWRLWTDEEEEKEFRRRV